MEKDKKLTLKLVSKLIDTVAKCDWKNSQINNVNYYELKIEEHKVILWKSLGLQNSPFLQVKKGDMMLEENYYHVKVKDLYEKLNQRYNTVEKEKQSAREKVFNAILTELNLM